ncbi:MAG: hypothetical protein HYX94_09740 [Chloroflexi bacterium]|nr:hypothetical protein [Chloroflexota bacterium]
MEATFAKRKRDTKADPAHRLALEFFLLLKTFFGPVRLLLVVALFAVVAQELIISRYTVDDAFISFRYARNLVEGNGLVFNSGERVEGYTNFLWTMTLAGALLVKLDPEVIAKGLGILASLGTIYLVYRLSLRTRSQGSPWLFSIVALALLAANGAFATSAITGLETSLFSFLILAGACAAIRASRMTADDLSAGRRSTSDDERVPLPIVGDRWQHLTPLIFALAALTRPEGVAAFATTLVFKALSRNFHRDDFKQCACWLAVFAAIYLPYFAWRLWYYDELLPNTFYAKTGAGLAQFYVGLLDVGDFSEAYVGIVFLLALVVLARRKAPFWLTYVTALALTFVLLDIYEGGDWIPFFRFLVPALPFYYLVIQEAARLLHKSATSRLPRPAANLGLGLACLALVVLAVRPSFEMYEYLTRAEGGQETAHATLGRWLKDKTTEPVALMDIGRIGYFSRLPVIDTSGLTDRTIAHSTGGMIDKEFDLAYVLGRQPRYFVLASTTDYLGSGTEPTDFPIEKRIFEDQRFHERYAYRFTLDWGTVVDGKGYYLMVYERI